MKLALTLLIVMAILVVVWASETWLDRYRPKTGAPLRLLLALARATAVAAIGVTLAQGGELVQAALAPRPFPLWAFMLVLAASAAIAGFGWLSGRAGGLDHE